MYDRERAIRIKYEEKERIKEEREGGSRRRRVGRRKEKGWRVWEGGRKEGNTDWAGQGII